MIVNAPLIIQNDSQDQSFEGSFLHLKSELPSSLARTMPASISPAQYGLDANSANALWKLCKLCRCPPVRLPLGDGAARRQATQVLSAHVGWRALYNKAGPITPGLLYPPRINGVRMSCDETLSSGIHYARGTSVIYTRIIPRGLLARSSFTEGYFVRGKLSLRPYLDRACFEEGRSTLYLLIVWNLNLRTGLDQR